MSEELPIGWASGRLEEIVTKQKGKKPGVLRDSPATGFVPYLDIRAIEKNEIREFAEVKSSKLASDDDLFVVWDGARSGWVGGGISGAIGSTIMSLTPQKMESGYLRQYIASQFRTLNTNTRGTGIPHVDPEVFWNLEVPLAPLAEQRRIVAKLEALLGKVDACQQRLAKIPTILKRFRQSVLAAACSGRLTADWRESHESEPWQSLAFGNVVISSFYGPRFGAQDYSDSGVPTIRTTDMDYRGNIDLSQSPRIKLSSDELDRLGLKDGDLLVTRTGATIGKCALYSSSQGPAIPSAYLIRFRLNQTMIDPRFALLFLLSPTGQAQLTGGSTAVAQPNVNARAISAFSLERPPLPEQHEIVRRVEALFAFADKIEARFAKAQAQVDRLTPSLLAKAFRGDLVPQDPRDEPASVLLDRIRAERAADRTQSIAG